MTDRTFIATDPARTAIYGIGHTAEEAIADARDQDGYGSDDAERASHGGSYVAAPCTEALYRHVQTHGGAIAWDETDGVADLPDEA